MLLAYSARSSSRGMVERSQLGEYFIGCFLPGYLPAPATTLEAPLTQGKGRGGVYAIRLEMGLIPATIRCQ